MARSRAAEMLHRSPAGMSSSGVQAERIFFGGLRLIHESFVRERGMARMHLTGPAIPPRSCLNYGAARSAPRGWGTP